MFTRTTNSIGLSAELQSAESMDIALYRRASDRIRWTREMLARPNGPGPVAMVKKMGTAAGQFFRSTDVAANFIALANKSDGLTAEAPKYLPEGYKLQINPDDSAELIDVAGKGEYAGAANGDYAGKAQSGANVAA